MFKNQNPLITDEKRIFTYFFTRYFCSSSIIRKSSAFEGVKRYEEKERTNLIKRYCTKKQNGIVYNTLSLKSVYVFMNTYKIKKN